MKANQVSRILKAGGLTPVSPQGNREGVICTNNHVRVSVDGTNHAARLMSDVTAILADAGVSFTQTSERIVRVDS